jgi:hypothetical protein
VTLEERNRLGWGTERHQSLSLPLAAERFGSTAFQFEFQQ